MMMNVDENLVTTDIHDADGLPISANADSHNYNMKEGLIYSYIGAVSEEDAKKGKAVGDVSTFAFRGVIDGLYRISSVDDEGRTVLYYECPKPCVIMKRHLGGEVTRLPYSPDSVIGAAFEDALNGRLEVAKEPPKPKPSALTGHDGPGADAGSSEFEQDGPDGEGPENVAQ